MDSGYRRARPGLSWTCFQGHPKDLPSQGLLGLGYPWTFTVLRPALPSILGWGGSQVPANSCSGCGGLRDWRAPGTLPASTLAKLSHWIQHGETGSSPSSAIY